MKENEKASLSIIKIICIAIIFIICSGIYAFANNSEINNVRIILSNKYELSVLTSKTKVSEILNENHIMILPEEFVIPGIDQEIDANKTIIISKDEEELKTIQIAQETSDLTLEQILKKYEPIVEKIVVEKVEIPFETITKTVTSETTNVYNQVIQSGRNGLKEVTYRVKYQNEEVIEKVELSSKTIREPRNRIVQVQKRTVTSRSLSGERLATDNPALTASTTLAKKVEGITPSIKTFNSSAYCACMKCCGKTNAITASGAKATAWYTLAAGSGFKFGTVIYVPALKDKPNGGWFVVQDRGGAISNNKLDIFTSTHNEALQFGRRNLECYIYEI